MSQRIDAHTSTRLFNHSVLATEFKPALKWLGHRVLEDTDGHKVLNKVNFTEDECHGMSLDDKDREVDIDEIEEW